MPWFKVDDKLHSHVKAARAGLEAMGLWTIAGSWSMDQLTDGFVPDYIAARLHPKAKRLAAALVKAGLWDEAEKDGDTGWQFHDWDEYQPTRDETEAKREAERERKRAWRAKSSASASRGDGGRFQAVSQRDNHGDDLGDSHRESTATRPDPTRPDPKESASALSARKPRRKPERALPDDWKPNAKHAEQAMAAGVSLPSEVLSFRDHALSHDRRCVDWDAAFRNWLRKAKPEPSAVVDKRPEAWR